MDPISIFSLFCNVITVVDVAVKATRGLKELYDSGTGFSKANQQIEEETRRLSDIAKELSESRDHLSSYASTQRPLVEKVAQECTRVAEQIQLVLDKCRVGPQAPKAVAVLKAWVKSTARKSALDELQTQFEGCADGLRMAMAAATRADLCSMKETLAKIAVGQGDLIEKMSLITKQLSSQQATLADMNRLLSLAQEAQLMINHGLIIRALKPLTMHSRESEVVVRYHKTFDWVVDPGTDSQRLGTTMTFVDWLRDGSGVFHFSGKPGSGKSTLMKFLVNEPRVMEFLRKWATERGKMLLVGKFFFWRHGSNEQKSVSGLLRGLLYEMCHDSPELTKLLFPEAFTSGAESQGPEMRIGSEQIREAFDLLRLDPQIGEKFALCVFIDGLDEFDGAEMAHWRLAKVLREWSAVTDNGIALKLCISSREDHAILAAFETCQRVRLQGITHGDICSLVEDTLDSNEYFQRLKSCDRDGSCQGLVKMILKGADGVFLWVTMLLNLLEDELPSVSSIQQLYGIVETTPSRIDDFIGSILETIKKHHRRGAYFLLAMALRMVGFHLRDSTKFPPCEDSMHRTIFEFERYWRPHLPVYGLSIVMETLETHPEKLFPGYREILAKAQDMDHQMRTDDAGNKIRSWCKGLLDVVIGHPEQLSKTLGIQFWDSDSDEGSGSDSPTYLPESEDPNTDYKLTLAKFMHRAIPEYLMSIIRDQASYYKFDDQDVAEGILIAIIAETSSSSYNDQQPSDGGNLAYYMQHVLRLLRMRPMESTGDTSLLLDDLERVRFDVWRRKGCQTGSLLPPGSQQTFVLRLDDTNDTDHIAHSLSAGYTSYLVWDHSATVLAHASHAGLYEYMQWKFNPGDSVPIIPNLRPPTTGHMSGTDENHTLRFSALCGLTSYYTWFWSEFPATYTRTLKVLISAGAFLKNPASAAILTQDIAGSDHIGTKSNRPVVILINSQGHVVEDPLLPLQWPWISIIPSVLNVLVKNTPPVGVWNFLEAWLIGTDAPAPYRISCGYKAHESSMYLTGPLDDDGVNRESRTRRSGPLTVTYRIGVTYHRKGASSSNGNDEATHKHIFKGVFILDLGRRDRPGNVNHTGFEMSQRVIGRKPGIPCGNQGAGNDLASCFGSARDVEGGMAFKEVSLADLVRYHSPPNRDVLLENLRKRGYDSAVGVGES